MMNGGAGGSGTTGISADRLREYVVDSNQALRFRLVKAGDDVEEATQPGDREGDFPPEMTHQIYGESENIFGYRDLKVRVLMSAGGLQCHIVQVSGDPLPAGLAKKEGLRADDVMPPIVKLMADGQVSKSMGEFKKYLKNEEAKFKPMGEKMHEFNIGQGPEQRTFEIFKCDATVPGFVSYHKRLQPWIMFYIDAASYIDSDDANWIYFLLYERLASGSHCVAGFITVYRYYGYPEHARPRISQMLVLPPFQRMGLGARLLDAVERHFWKDSKVIDITVEDPSEEFVRLRDFVDCANCLKMLPKIFDSKEVLSAGFTEQMHEEARKELKICKRQARRVYEILRLRATNRSLPNEVSAYRVDVKKRLNAPYKKEEQQLSKLKKHLKPEEFAATTATVTNRTERLETLQTQYEELEEHYDKIIARLPPK